MPCAHSQHELCGQYALHYMLNVLISLLRLNIAHEMRRAFHWLSGLASVPVVLR
jgi:hypothetical protein